MTNELAMWLVLGAPLAAFLIIIFGTRAAGAHGASAWVGMLAIGVSLLASLSLLAGVMAAPG